MSTNADVRVVFKSGKLHIDADATVDRIARPGG